ncbi:MAG: hypothetical protein RL764_191 [Pseudomonadota bacterium]|jgi:hypothetical protein
MKRVLFTATLAGLMAATPGFARQKPVPEAKPVGEPVNCISINQIQESRVRSDSIIDFRVSGKKWYRNTLPQSCPSLGYEERFSYRTSTSQLCSVDTIAVLQNYGSRLQEGPHCGLGKFQPVELVRPTKK